MDRSFFIFLINDNICTGDIYINSNAFGML